MMTGWMASCSIKTVVLVNGLLNVNGAAFEVFYDEH